MKWLAFLLLFVTPAVASADTAGVRVADGFADCIIESMPKQSRALLEMAPASTEERALLAKFGKVSGCMGVLRGQLRMSAEFMRGAIANALYRRQYAQSPVTNVGVTNVPRATGVADLLAHDLARCLVSRVPASVHDFIVARAGTENAVTSFRPIAAEFPNCAPATGGLRTTHTLLRARLAEAIYDFRASQTHMTRTR